MGVEVGIEVEVEIGVDVEVEMGVKMEVDLEEDCEVELARSHSSAAGVSLVAHCTVWV